METKQVTYSTNTTDADRRRKQATRYARLLCVSDLVSQGDSVETIAGKLAVTPRTVYRDLLVLQEAERIMEHSLAEES